MHILVPVRSWLKDPGWKQGSRLLVIAYGLLPSLFVVLFSATRDLSAPGWAYSLAIAPLWAVAFWLLVRRPAADRGGDQFRARNYEKAAKSVAGYGGDVDLLDETALRKIPGVGSSIAAKIIQFQRTGTIAELEDLRASVPDGVREMTRIPALGPKRAFQLYRELGIGSIAELSAAIDDGRLKDLRGFGAKSEDKLRRGIELAQSFGQRVPLNVASDVAERIVAAISAVPGCERCEHAGSLRRFRETIGDVDILAAASDSGPLMRTLTELPGVTDVIARGEAKTSVRISTAHISTGRPAGGRRNPGRPAGRARALLGHGMLYFTGSQAHNVAIREIAVRRKLKLSEYGLFDVESGRAARERHRGRGLRAAGARVGPAGPA